MQKRALPNSVLFIYSRVGSSIKQRFYEMRGFAAR